MKVWAYHGTKWAFVSNSKYKCTPFDGLADLYTTLKKESWTTIDELCIISHGDRSGYIDIEPPLTDKSALAGFQVTFIGRFWVTAEDSLLHKSGDPL